MRKYANLPINQLVSDVAVDPVHVRELADSIKISGPISPVLVRDDTLELIDGFHRVAAIKELGFGEVECILTPCNDETFWDLRIMSATLHKAVTFSRAVDWIDESFVKSSIASMHNSAYAAFHAVRDGFAKPEVKDWVQSKAQKWGLSIQTIENWLETKRRLAPELYAEAKKDVIASEAISVKHYDEIGRGLPGRAELQRAVVDKVKREGLTADQTREVARALRQASDQEEVKAVLERPFTRRAEDVVREVKVERLISAPEVRKAREEAERIEMAADVVRLKLLMEEVAAFGEEFDLALLDNLGTEHVKGLISAIDRAQSSMQSIRNRLEELAKEPRRAIISGEYKVLPSQE